MDLGFVPGTLVEVELRGPMGDPTAYRVRETLGALRREQAEWVLVLRGSAQLQFEGQAEAVELGPGDYVLIPAHCRHRVQWTDPRSPTVWLALHFTGTNSMATSDGDRLS